MHDLVRSSGRGKKNNFFATLKIVHDLVGSGGRGKRKKITFLAT